MPDKALTLPASEIVREIEVARRIIDRAPPNRADLSVYRRGVPAPRPYPDRGRDKRTNLLLGMEG